MGIGCSFGSRLPANIYMALALKLFRYTYFSLYFRLALQFLSLLAYSVTRPSFNPSNLQIKQKVNYMKDYFFILEYGQWLILVLSILALYLVSSVRHKTRLKGYLMTALTDFQERLYFYL